MKMQLRVKRIIRIRRISSTAPTKARTITSVVSADDAEVDAEVGNCMEAVVGTVTEPNLS